MIDPIQIHLSIVHVPVLATVFATWLWAMVVFRNRLEWKALALGIFILSAFAATAAFFSGHGSEDMAESLRGVTENLIHEHEEAATIGFSLALTSGAVAAFILVMGNRLPHRLRRHAGSLLILLGVAGSVAFLVAAHRGGLIRHPELAPAKAAEPFQHR